VNVNPVVKPHVGSAARASVLETFVPTMDRTVADGGAPQQQDTSPISLISTTGGSGLSLSQHDGTVVKPIAFNSHISSLHQEKERGKGGTMSRGNVGKSVARMDAFTWLSNVKVGGTTTRESSSGTDIASGGYDGISTPGSYSGMGSKSRVGLDLAEQMRGHFKLQIQETQAVQEGESEDKGAGEGDFASRGQAGRVRKRESQSWARGRVMQVQRVKQKGSQDESRKRTSVSQSRISSDDKKETENQPLQDE